MTKMFESKYKRRNPANYRLIHTEVAVQQYNAIVEQAQALESRSLSDYVRYKLGLPSTIVKKDGEGIIQGGAGIMETESEVERRDLTDYCRLFGLLQH